MLMSNITLAKDMVKRKIVLEYTSKSETDEIRKITQIKTFIIRSNMYDKEK